MCGIMNSALVGTSIGPMSTKHDVTSIGPMSTKHDVTSICPMSTKHDDMNVDHGKRFRVIALWQCGASLKLDALSIMPLPHGRGSPPGIYYTVSFFLTKGPPAVALR